MRIVLGLISKYKSLVLLEILEGILHTFNESFLLLILPKNGVVGFQRELLADFKAESSE